MNHCEKCGSTLGSSALGGFCARCLFATGIEDAGPGDDSTRISGPLVTRSIGGYELLEEIARGGMGIVYRARQSSLGRIVAVKILSAGEFATPEGVQRFHSEAAAAARLQHPNIVAIHEVGDQQGVRFFSMDYVEGPSLTQFAARRSLSAAEGAGIVKTIAEAVHYAHQKGILHRDLKPSNVLIDPFGEPRLTDFGLAKELSGSSDLTRSGEVLGTPGYMPPEQADSAFGAVSPASDVYSLGAILYFTLTNRPPFASPSLHETLRQVIEHDPVKPRLLNPSVPADLETICLKCLQKDPHRRYATAAELAADLERFQDRRPILARPIGQAEVFWRWCRREPAAAALAGAVFLLLAALAAGASFAALRVAGARDAQRAEARRAERTVTLLETQRAEDLLREDRVSPALAHLAHALRGDPSNQVAAARIASALLQRSFALPIRPAVPLGGPARLLAFHPDGRTFAAASDAEGVMLLGAADGLPVGRAPQPDPVRFGFYSADGSILYTAGAEQLRAWDPKARREIRPPVIAEGPLSAAAASADGAVCVTGSGTHLRAWNGLTGKPLREPMDQAFEIEFLDITPDGRRAIAAGGRPGAHARLWDVATGRLIAELPLGGPFRIEAASFSPDGGRVVTGDYGGRVAVWDSASGRLVWDANKGSVVEAAVFSPDSTRIAVGVRDAFAQILDALTGEPLGPPLRHATVVSQISFNADGRLLLTRCWDDTAWVWNAATGARYIETLHLDQPVADAALSPDGERLVTATTDGSLLLWDIRPGRQLPMSYPAPGYSLATFTHQSARLFAAGTEGGARTWDAVTSLPVSAPIQAGGTVNQYAAAPDGRHVATCVFGGGGRVWNSETGALVASFGGPDSTMDWIEFSPDSARILAGDRKGRATLWDAQTGKALGAPMAHNNRLWMARFSPDGRRIATASDDHTGRVWDADTGKPITPPLPHGDSVYAVNFSPDGARVVTASFDLTARVWNAVTGEPLGRPLKHHSGLRWACFSPDGAKIVTVSGDHTARLWDANQFTALTEPLQHNGEVRYAIFSSDSTLLFTSSFDGTTRAWSVESGQPITEPLHGNGLPRTISLSGDHRWLAVGESGAAVVHELPPWGLSPPSWLADLAEAVAGEHVSDVGFGFEPVPPASLLKLVPPAHSVGEDPWDRFRRWFFADRSVRPLSPSAVIPRKTLLDRLAQENSFEALVNAFELAPGRGPVLLNLVRRTVLDDQGAKQPWSEPDFFRRWLLSTPEADWVRAVMNRSTNLGANLAAMRAAEPLFASDERFFRFEGIIAAKAQQWPVAFAAFERALPLAGANSNIWRFLAAGRRNALLQLDRREEAGRAPFPLAIPPRDPRATPSQLDLSGFFNAGLDEDWTDYRAVGNTLKNLQPGLSTLDGVSFDVRGVIQLTSLEMANVIAGYPEGALQIPVRQRCRRLHFLQAGAFTRRVPAGVVVGTYRIHYADGGEASAPVVVGQDIDEWWLTSDRPAPAKAPVAWRGVTPAGSKVGLYHAVWVNPNPDREIAAFDFVSANTASAPFLVAVTAD